MKEKNRRERREKREKEAQDTLVEVEPVVV
jgi:hypothetical protein